MLFFADALRDIFACTGDFGVDKEAQAKVSEAMDTFLKGDGGLLLYVMTRYVLC